MKKSMKHEEEQKKRADTLWSDFMSDVGGGLPLKKKSNTQVSSSSNNHSKAGQSSKTDQDKTPTEKKVSITKIFDFAGEEVR